MKVLKHSRLWIIISTIMIFVSFAAAGYADYTGQTCVTGMLSAQIGSADYPDMNATAPEEMKEFVDNCSFRSSMFAAAFLGFTSFWAVSLGIAISDRLRTRSSTTVYAHYEPDSHKLILRFNKPTIVHNPQRMILLYNHADGMDSTISGRQCGNSGLTLAFATDIEKSPTHMELVICSGVMHPAGFPESDVCADGKPIHVDVDILCTM